MNYEKAYKEALERAKESLKDGTISSNTISYIEEIFPELKESEGERIRKALIKYYSFDKDGGSHALDNITPNQIVVWLEKQGEHSHVWSEEDEKMYQSIMDDTVQENQLSSNQINWLRDIKYRYFPQLKQKWSEEDEDILNTIINHFEIDLECTKNDDIIRWLKSLRPQNRWKPSDEQMKAIEHICDGNYKVDLDILDSIYRDFKKLRGE